MAVYVTVCPTTDEGELDEATEVVVATVLLAVTGALALPTAVHEPRTAVTT